MNRQTFLTNETGGSKEANTDFSSSNATNFILVPPSESFGVITIQKIVISGQCTNTTTAQYGGLNLSGGAGIKIQIQRKKDGRDAQIVRSLFDGEAIKTINDLLQFGKLTLIGDGSNTTGFQCEIEFTGRGISYNPENHERLAIPLSQNFATGSTLTKHRFLAFYNDQV